MKITLVGYGYVGKAIFNAFNPTYEMKIVDPKYSVLEVESDDENIVIAVGTPYKDGCDISQIIATLKKVTPSANVLIKSTVDMRGVSQIASMFPDHNITYSPEFLRGDTANADFLATEYHILGGEDTSFWEDALLHIFPSNVIYSCSALEASVIKYAENSFLGMKVTFFNQLFDVADMYDVDFEVVRELLTKDKRINDDHSYVTEERGYGGHCLPKDINSLIDNLADHQYVSLMSHIEEYNKKIRGDLTDS